MSRLLCIAMLTILAMAASASLGLVHANVPTIKSVIVFDVDGNTHLNVTINHLDQNQSHYVDMISVEVIGGNLTDFQFGYRPTAPNGDVVYECDLGPIPEERNALLVTHCSLHGPSLDIWSGAVPEFSVPTLLLALALITTVASFAFRKTKSNVLQ